MCENLGVIRVSVLGEHLHRQGLVFIAMTIAWQSADTIMVFAGGTSFPFYS